MENFQINMFVNLNVQHVGKIFQQMTFWNIFLSFPEKTGFDISHK